ncbi:MAG: PDZ domain-containing protein [Pirellulaceae bacterium]
MLNAQTELDSWDQRVIQQAVANISPSVVQIETIGGSGQVGGMPVPDQPATGTIVNSDGFIVTAAINVAHEPNTIFVRLPDGTRWPADLVSRNHSRQVALLKVQTTEDLVFASPDFVPRSQMKPGQTAIAVGRTMSLEQCNLSTGIISATNRIRGRAIQTDASISPNNFGGPLVDLDGRILGILVPLSPRGESVADGLDWYDSGIGFAVPLDELELLAMSSGEDLHPGRMGISFNEDQGYASPAIVAECRGNSPAANAGIQKGDEIIRVANVPVERVSQVRQVIGPMYAGQAVTMVCSRDGKEFDAVVDLVAKIEPFRHTMLGVIPDPHDTCLIQSIMDSGPAKTAGLEAGDRIVKLGGEAVNNAEQIVTQLISRTAGDTVEVAIDRNGEIKTVNLELNRLDARPVPSRLLAAGEDEPVFTQIRVPEHANECQAYIPDIAQPRGVLLWLGEPGPFDAEAELEKWQPLCDRYGLALLLPRSEEDRAWQPGEMEFLAKAVRQVSENHNVDPRRIAVGGSGSGGVMASLVCMSHRDLFGGLVLLESGTSQRLSSVESEAMNRLMVLMLQPAAAGKPTQKQLAESASQLDKQGFAVHSETLDEQAEALEIVCGWIATLSRF